MILHPGKIHKKIKKKVSPLETVGEESRVFLQGLYVGVSENRGIPKMDGL